MKIEQIKIVNMHIINSVFSLCEAYGTALPPVEAIVDLTDGAMEYIQETYPNIIGDYGQMYMLIGNTITNYMMMYRAKKVWGR